MIAVASHVKRFCDVTNVGRSRIDYCNGSLMGGLESDSHGSKGHLCGGYREGLWPGSIRLEKWKMEITI